MATGHKFFFLLALSSLYAQDLPPEPRGLSAPFPGLQEKLEFTENENEYFSNELTLPGEPLPAQQPEKLKAKIDIEATLCEESAWQIVFRFSKPVTYREEVDECGGLSLAFNQEVDSPDLLEVQEKLGYLLKEVSNGLYTLYFLPERPVCFYTEAIDTLFILHIVPQYQCPVAATRFLKLARMRLLVEEYYYYQAFDAIYDFLAEYPGEKDALLLLGTLENLLPRWQRSAAVFGYLRNRYPHDDTIQALLHDVFFPHSSYINFTREIQSTESFSVYQLNRLQSEWIIRYSPCDVMYIGGLFLATRGHLSTVVNDDGAIEGFLGNRYQGSLYLRDEMVWGDAYTGRLYLGEGVVFGAGAEAKWLWPALQGDFTLIADWHRPYWELFETLAFFGREDRLKFEITSVYDRFYNWNFGGGIERIGIADVPTALISLLVSGDIYWHLKVGNPIVSFNYAFDADYVVYEKEKTSPLGNRFVRVPLTSYEFHFLRAYIQWEMCDKWFCSAYGGGSFNRLGTNDWTVGGSIIYRKPCPCGWEIELSGSRFPSTTVQGSSTDYFTISVTARF